MDRAEIDTERLYTGTERAEARHLYAKEHPNGPAWEEADLEARGRFLEVAAANWRERLGEPRG